jgi:hypothetical protein
LPEEAENVYPGGKGGDEGGDDEGDENNTEFKF